MIFEYISLSDRKSAQAPESNILCLGNFDGVHLGHRALLKTALLLKNTKYPTAMCGVFCFRTLPSDDLLSNPPKHLCTLDQKLALFRSCGMDFVILADFASIKQLPPNIFAKDVLLEKYHAAAIVCGFNYRYGYNRSGTPADLKDTLPIPVAVVDEVVADGETVSSSRIRRLLSAGDVETAARLLTRPYTFIAPVEHGKALGRRLGTPTINQYFPQSTQVPRHGVYITDCTVDGVTYRGVTNVGTRPTVDSDTRVNCETYLLDFNGSLYGKEVEVAFISFLRPEHKFESYEALRAQIAVDVARAKVF